MRGPEGKIIVRARSRTYLLVTSPRAPLGRKILLLEPGRELPTIAFFNFPLKRFSTRSARSKNSYCSSPVENLPLLAPRTSFQLSLFLLAPIFYLPLSLACRLQIVMFFGIHQFSNNVFRRVF